MRRFVLSAAIVLLLIPTSASAYFSFGGRIATVVPCLSTLGPALHITIAPAGVFPVMYIWTPFTLTFMAGPPRNPGQQVIGLYDVPFVCFVGKVPFYGQRIFMIGTSLAI